MVIAPKPKGVRAYDFVCTLWTEESLEIFKKEAEVANYAVAGKEICPDTGKLHYQSYIWFPCQRTLTAVRKRLPGCDVRVAYGHFLQSSDYCHKDGDVVFEIGTRKHQGARGDVESVRDSIVAGMSVDDVCMENPAMFHQYGRTLSRIEDIVMRRKFRTEMTTCIWYFGVTGSGKSHIAFQDFNPDTVYAKPHDGNWWDAYKQQETVVINEFRGDIPYGFLLELCDKYPAFVARRNREPLPFMSKRIVITSVLHPREIYHNLSENDTLAQLLRRISIVELASRTGNAGRAVIDV